MKYKIVYWSSGDATVERDVEVKPGGSLQAEIEKLKDDPQEPLGQIKHIEFLG